MRGLEALNKHQRLLGAAFALGSGALLAFGWLVDLSAFSNRQLGSFSVAYCFVLGLGMLLLPGLSDFLSSVLPGSLSPGASQPPDKAGAAASAQVYAGYPGYEAPEGRIRLHRRWWMVMVLAVLAGCVNCLLSLLDGLLF